MQNPIYSSRIIQKNKEVITSRRTHSYNCYTEKDESPFSPLAFNIEGISSKFSNSFKDPTKKKRRFDYQIFFGKNSVKLNKFRPITASKEKKTLSPFPARFNHSYKQQTRKLRFGKCAESDLKLIKDINCDSNKKRLEMEKLYRDYVLNFQEPTENEVPNGDGEINLEQKVKKVRFNLQYIS